MRWFRIGFNFYPMFDVALRWQQFGKVVAGNTFKFFLQFNDVGVDVSFLIEVSPGGNITNAVDFEVLSTRRFTQ